MGAALNLSNTHPSAPAIDVLDLVMKGRQGQTLEFVEAGVRNGSLADPSCEFGQIVAGVLDHGMSPAEWVALTGDKADPVLREGCLGVWLEEILGRRFVGRYGVSVQRHDGRDHAILAARHELYLRAREQHPRRWSGATRNWTPIAEVTLNPEREAAVRRRPDAAEKQPLAA